jgi:CheY-like chemotaxis protein
MAFGLRGRPGWPERANRAGDGDEALAAEIDVVERVRGRYPRKVRINFGAPTRCPRCAEYGLVDRVDLVAGDSDHRCLECGNTWSISVRALLAADGRATVEGLTADRRGGGANASAAWRAELARRRLVVDGLAATDDLPGVRYSLAADGEVVSEPVTGATRPLPAPPTSPEGDDGPDHWIAPVLPLRVLLVEDDPDHVRTVRSLVEPGGGVDLRTATTRAAGEVCARVSQPDLVLLDLGLPDSRGAETLAGWQEHGGDAPVLVVRDDDTSISDAGGADATPGVAGVVDRAELSRLLALGDEGRTAFLDILGHSSAPPGN